MNNFDLRVTSRDLNKLMALARKPEMFEYIYKKLKSPYSMQIAKAIVNIDDSDITDEIRKYADLIKTFIN